MDPFLHPLQTASKVGPGQKNGTLRDLQKFSDYCRGPYPKGPRTEIISFEGPHTTIFMVFGP